MNDSERVIRQLATTPAQVELNELLKQAEIRRWQQRDAEQAELFAKPLTDERIDELIVDAAKRSGFGVIMKGERVSGHCGGYTQEHTVIKIGMDQFRPRQIRGMFTTFLTLANTEA